MSANPTRPSEVVVERALGKPLVDLSSPSAEPFRSLRLAVGMRREGRAGEVILFTSAEPGEGKSTIAANYARVCSMSTNSVALVDADMRQPNLHEIFGISRAPGLVDVCLDQITVDEAIIPVRGFGQLAVLPAGSSFARTADIASSPRMGRVLEELQASYGTIVVDTPPLLSAADAGALSTIPGVDVVLVVDKSAKRRTVLNAVRKLELISANVIGVVLNHQGRLSTYGY
jgi:capsular exopolysaccharide synthesis family protein